MSDSVNVSTVYLYDTQSESMVEAELWDAITDKNIADWEAKWRPELFRLLDLLHANNIDLALWPESKHWNWNAKRQAIVQQQRLDQPNFSVVYDDVTQAMMITQLTRRAKLESQKNDHIVYVDFVEAAPWNRKEILQEQPQLSGCGSVLIGAAIELSISEGFKGRIGLHSLPQANDFYSNKIGMTDLGKDPNYENLRYYEMTPDQAESFRNKGG